MRKPSGCFPGSILRCSRSPRNYPGSEIAVLARDVRLEGDGPELAVFVQGNLETMVTEDCLRAVAIKCRRTSGPCRNTRWLGIRDETGLSSRYGLTAPAGVISSTPPRPALSMRCRNWWRTGIVAVTIDARGKPADYAREMVRVYREAIASAAQKPGAATRDTAAFKERVKAIALGGITAGHYTRGLKEE